MSEARSIDVSGLPTYGYSHRSLTWWGTWGIIVIEGTVFVAALMVYFYLRTRTDAWPPEDPPPRLLFGTLNLAVLLLSGIPNWLAQRAAEHEQLGQVRLWLTVGVLFAMVFLGVRALEYPALNTTYTNSAYGSIVFALLTLHTAHIVTDTIDSIVLLAIMWVGPLEGRRFVDVSENSLYFWFVIISWIPIYLTIYIAPRIG